MTFEEILQGLMKLWPGNAFNITAYSGREILLYIKRVDSSGHHIELLIASLIQEGIIKIRISESATWENVRKLQQGFPFLSLND